MRGDLYTQAVEQRMGEKVVQGVVVGRDKKVVPPKEVEDLAAMGCKDSEIALWFGVSESTLRYQFSANLIKGRENLKQTLRQAQIKLALGGNAVMLIWLGKNILGQSDSPTTTQDRQPLPWNDSEEDLEEDKLTPEAKEKLKAQLKEQLAQLEDASDAE
jgi:hypothetical protein